MKDLLGNGYGPAWLAWRRKVDLLPAGVAVLDKLSRRDWPGDDASWDRFVGLQQQAAGLCRLPAQEGWEPPPEQPPARFPSGMWRGLGELEQTDAVQTAAVWVSDWHNPETRPRRGLLLVGPVGVGKTAIATALAHDIDPYAYWHVTDLLAHLMDGYADNSFAFKFRNLAERRVLVVDDLGAERDTDGQTDLVVKLLDHRHRKDGLTVVTTNVTSVLRERRYGQRFESRLRDLCRTVKVLGVDRRAA